MALSSAAPFAARAAARRIGMLSYGSAPLAPVEASLIEAMAERGLRQGSNIELDIRFADGRAENLVPRARDIVAAAPDLMICLGGDVARALRDAGPTLPIVAGVSDDPVRAGLASSYARPDRLFTGLCYLTDEMAAKRLQLLREAAPAARRIGVVWNPQHFDDEISSIRSATDKLGFEVVSLEVSSAEELKAGLDRLRDLAIDSMFVIASRFTLVHRKTLVDFAAMHRIPLVGAWREYTDSGALLSYGPNRRAEASILAAQIERALKGTPIRDIPIERSSRFELIVNRRVAKRLGLQLPQSLLLAADEIVE